MNKIFILDPHEFLPNALGTQRVSGAIKFREECPLDIFAPGYYKVYPWDLYQEVVTQVLDSLEDVYAISEQLIMEINEDWVTISFTYWKNN